MDLTDENLQIMANYLSQTLNPDVNIRRPAEKFLEGVEVNKNYPLLLLHLVDKTEIDMTIRVAGAIAFKNYIKRNWEITEDKPNRIHDEDRLAVKQLIVELMLRSPELIQKQLSDAISVIGKYDFPNKWPDLIEKMVNKFVTGDFHIINGVLVTAHSLFKKYRYMFKSNELWTEIKLVLEKMAKPLTDLLLATMNLAQVHADNEQALRVIYSSLVLICKVFYSLNFQDLPEFFEDNMDTWMQNFHTLLTVQVPKLQTDSDEEPGMLEQLKSQVCDNVTLYASKYDEEFRPYLPQFVTDIWELLVSTGQQTKYDSLVSNALSFLSTVAERAQYSGLFSEPGVLTNVCEKVLIPNMEIRPADEELFEDNPDEWVRRDLEGSDLGTRRRAAGELATALCAHHEANVAALCAGHVERVLAAHAAAPSSAWRGKHTALQLVTALAARGATQRHGVTSTTSTISAQDFGRQQVLPELANGDVNTLPMLKAAAIKYITDFRSLVPPEDLRVTLPHLVRLLHAKAPVVRTYASAAIDKLLQVRTLQPAELSPLAADMLNGLFTALDQPGSEENEYIMKAIMRAIQTLQQLAVPFLGAVLPKLTVKLQIVTKNPSRPHFNHYLFETLSLCIRIVCKTNPEAVGSFEDALLPTFQIILQQDVQEFIPYVFELMALLVELGASTTPYAALLPCLLAPTLWERQANTHPLVRLLCSFTIRAPDLVADKTNGFLGVFQKLIASKNNDHEGFLLIQTMLQQLPSDSLLQYHKQIFFLLFQRLSSSKTTKYVKGLVVFFCFYVIKFSAAHFIELVDSIQAQMFGMVVEKILIPDIQKVNGNIERKIAACGLVKLLCDCPPVFSGPYQKFWVPLLEALICLFELPQDETTFADDHFIEVDDAPTFEQAYSKLNFAKSNQIDPLEGVTDSRQLLATSLGTLSSTNPGRLTEMIAAIGPDHQQVLKRYLGSYNVHVI